MLNIIPMKNKILQRILLTLLILSAYSVTTCKKKTDPVPDFPQLIGHWSGTTSQGTQVRFMVDNLKGYLYIMEYHLTLYTSAGLHEYQSYYTYGIAPVSNKQFRIHMGTGSAGEAYMDGTFDLNAMTLYGTYEVYPPGNTTDIITGTYSCSMGTKK
jgi:hypothetical protein